MNIQYKKGVLDMCVLSMLQYNDSYGYDLADALSKKIQVADGTVYPILRKLATDKLVTTYLKESQNGPPRKYYHLTEDGEKKLIEMREDWLSFSKVVEDILEGEHND